MLIIIEGPDGVGKTTLAHKLQDEIQRADPRSTVVMMRKGPPTQHPLDEYLQPLQDYRPDTGVHYVLDRWHWGEYVYPRLTGRKTQLDDPVWWYLNAYVRRLGGIVVLCEADSTTVAQTNRGAFDHDFDSTEYEQVTKLFGEASQSATVPQVIYSWRNEASVVDVDYVIYAAQLWESYVAPLARYVTYSGAVRPEYLLLGDVRHGLDRVEQLVTRTNRQPAFVPYRGTSGHWLLSAVTSDVNLRASVAVANARDVDDVYQLWRDLGKPKVATLGRTAHLELLPYNIPHGQVPHPQFARRFYHHQQSSYAAALHTALKTGEDNSRWRGSLPVPPDLRSTPRSSTRFVDEDVSATRATA